MDERAISPVVGVTLMVVVTLLLASMFAVGAVNMADLGMERETVSDLTDESADESGDAPDAHASALIWAVDDGAGATTTHAVNYTIASDSDTAGNSLNSITIAYADGSVDVSGVDERSDVVLAGVDGDHDGTIEADATSDVECCPPGDGVIISDGGNTIRIEFSGNYNLEAGDALVVKYESVTNPNVGDYGATVTVNGDVDGMGTLEIED